MPRRCRRWSTLPTPVHWRHDHACTPLRDLPGAGRAVPYLRQPVARPQCRFRRRRAHAARIHRAARRVGAGAGPLWPACHAEAAVPACRGLRRCAARRRRPCFCAGPRSVRHAAGIALAAGLCRMVPGRSLTADAGVGRCQRGGLRTLPGAAGRGRTGTAQAGAAERGTAPYARCLGLSIRVRDLCLPYHADRHARCPQRGGRAGTAVGG
ncbi:hypothetical protein D3C72_1234330 [compost metagenome]